MSLIPDLNINFWFKDGERYRVWKLRKVYFCLLQISDISGLFQHKSLKVPHMMQNSLC